MKIACMNKKVIFVDLIWELYFDKNKNISERSCKFIKIIAVALI
jgi:hypothetical protein